MSRAIKFRAWDSIKKEMQSNFQWIDSHEPHMGGGVHRSFQFIHLTDKRCSSSCSSLRHEIMQSTGLKDKNGVEIYEGDYVSLWYAPRATARGWIKFENGGFYFKTIEAKPNICLAYNCIYEHGNSFTVIGNIYENPELLEGSA